MSASIGGEESKAGSGPAPDGAGLSIVLNGEARQLPVGTTLADLASQLQLAAGRFAVEVNEEIVPRSQHAARRLAAGDQVEVIGFVGGG
jgi:sulfur carrier protein